jgi:hypothetical protein
VRDARGYWEWASDAVSGDERVIEEILSRPDMAGLSGPQKNFVRRVISQSGGFLIPRFPLPGQPRIYPELKVYTPIERGDEREWWHWHGDLRPHWVKNGKPYIPDDEWPVYPPEAALYKGGARLVGKPLPAKKGNQAVASASPRIPGARPEHARRDEQAGRAPPRAPRQVPLPTRR